MKKNYLIALLALICNFAFAQLEQVTYRGAFAPTGDMWTKDWTNYNPGAEAYADASTVVNVTGNISSNTTWENGKTYKLNGLVYVTNNATLTIQAGVVVKGISSENGTALIVTKGAKINAIGTATLPIVFTSAKEAGSRLPGDWGGIVLLGKAGFNLNNGINYIEGITSNANTQYGGGSTPNDADNSGTLKYVRIEYAGFVFSPNNEINGLTMGSVGSGTTIDYVQVSYANDDAFEWFGGAVNCKHLVSYRNLDDDFDTDNGFKGSVQFGLILRDPAIADNPAISTSEGFESDNNADGNLSPSGYDSTSALFSNITAIGPKTRATIAPIATIKSGYERALRIRRRSELKIINSIFMDFKKNYLFVDGATTVDKLIAGKLKFQNNIMAGSSDGVLEYTGGVNFAGTSGSVIYPGLKLNGTGDDITPNAWFTGNGNSVIASSTNLLESPYGTSSNPADFSSLDYRPKADSPAFSGADFTGFITTVVNPDAPVGSIPVVANISYCKGAVATPLTATLTTTGSDLKWYVVKSGAGTTASPYVYTALTAAPTPSTSAIGTKVYGVTQKVSGFESAKAHISVTVNGLPTNLSAITGPVTGATAAPVVKDVSSYVGTLSPVVYQVALSAADTTVNNYTWSVPAGVTIVSGQGTNILTVNFKNVPQNVLAIGDISVRAKNTSLCFGAAVKVTLTAKLPVAASKLDLKNGTVKITDYAIYMGTQTPLALTSAVVASATTYDWDLPAGVTVSIPSNAVTGVVINETYTALPFLSTNTTPTTVGTKYWVVSKTPYTYDVNGVSTTTTISTCLQKIVGSSSSSSSAEAPKLYTFKITSDLTTAIPVGATFTYTDASSVTKTYTVRTSFAITAAAADKKLVCTTSSSTLTASDPSLTGALIGTGTYTGSVDFSGFTYAGAVINYGPTTSAPYVQYGTKVTSDKPAILVKFAGVTSPSTTALYFGVTAKNGVGFTSIDNSANTDANTTPGLYDRTYTEVFTAPATTGGPSSTTQSGVNATSTYTANGYVIKTSKLLKLVATAPAAPKSIAMINPATLVVAPASPVKVTDVSKFIGKTTEFKLTAAASTLATSYTWELPSGVNQISGGTTNIITVNFAGVLADVLSLPIKVKAVNTIDSSAWTTLTLTAAKPDQIKTLVNSTVLIPTTGGTRTQVYSFVAAKNANEYAITVPTGCTVTTTGNTATPTTTLTTSNLEFTVTFPTTYVSTTTANYKQINVVSKNGVGSSADKLFTIKSGAALTSGRVAQDKAETLVSNTEMYPNPASDVVAINVTATTNGTVDVTIYSFDGTIVSESKGLRVATGVNSFTENVSRLNKGIYLVRITNSTSNEVITKRLIKN